MVFGHRPVAAWVGLRWWCRGTVWLSRGGEFFDDDEMNSTAVLVGVPMFPRMGLWLGCVRMPVPVSGAHPAGEALAWRPRPSVS